MDKIEKQKSMQSHKKIAEAILLSKPRELLCVCKECKTPFIAVGYSIDESAKVRCAQCGSSAVSILREHIAR